MLKRERPTMQHSDAPSSAQRVVARVRVGLVLLAASAILLALCASAALAASLTYTLTPATVPYGQPVTVAGTVDPAAAGQQVAVAIDGVDVANAATDASGHFSVDFTPTKGGALTARLVADGTTGPQLTLAVQPVVTVKVLNATAFLRAVLRVQIAPAAYRGVIETRVLHHAVWGRTTHTVAKAGHTLLQAPLKGVGRFVVELTFKPSEGLAERSLRVTVKVAGHRVAAGSRGAEVRALLEALARLRFRVPGISSNMSSAAADAVVAFQKAYRLPRTYVFDRDDWAKLDRARLLRPRYARPKLHIEIDKGRQILMVVKHGAVLGIVPVSTGATGNTPEGTHTIMWKAYAASTPYGHGLLYWDMQFHPGFAMHAYPFVPPYPASHGCVRQPSWAAPWTYANSYAGETVYVYH